MQGFILHTQRVRDEDLIVYLLSSKALVKAYRFYGLRHSAILSGYKIDFELENSLSFLPRLKDTLHLSFSWLFDRDKMLLWQEFIRLFYKHLKDVESCEGFYFQLLEECVKKFEKQNPKRVIVDAYVRLLEFEGRLHKDFRCFACDKRLDEKVVLIRSFLCACPECVRGESFDKEVLEGLFTKKSSAHLDDEAVGLLFEIIKEGF